MYRVTAPDTINDLTLHDQISGGKVTFLYRTPTAEEQVQYHRQLWKRERNKPVSAVAETRLKFGMKIMTGFKKGGFAKLVEGTAVLYASDPEDQDYDPKWRELVKEYAGDLVMAFATNVFEGTFREFDELEAEDEEETANAEEGKATEEEKTSPNS